MIIHFESPEARSEFVAEVSEHRKDIAAHLAPGKTFPDLIVQDLTPQQVEWVQQHVAGKGQLFDDVQFRPFST
jgi:hypothetical protein